MTTIEHTVEIDAPLDDVWALLEDVRRLPEFSPSTEAVLDAPQRLTAVGQRFRQLVKLLGRSFDSEWRVVDLRPKSTIAIEGSVGYGVGYCLTQEVAAMSRDRSRLTVKIDYKLPFGPLGRVASKLGVESRARDESRQVVEGIRRIVEDERRAA
ncbi:MAG TPA: SRPBCC family protein [Acidimicrobiales bacterium]|nr:SRPBCC family protein [Acidimicrobiales bacterium]